MTDTKPYDIIERLRTPEEMAEYLIACAEIGGGDAGFMRKAVGDVIAAAFKLRAPGAHERAQLQTIVALADEVFPYLNIIDEREGAASGATEKIHDLANAIKHIALASAPAADERAEFEEIVKRLGGDCTWRPGYGYVSSMTKLYQNFWQQVRAARGSK